VREPYAMKVARTVLIGKLDREVNKPR